MSPEDAAGVFGCPERTVDALRPMRDAPGRASAKVLYKCFAAKPSAAAPNTITASTRIIARSHTTRRATNQTGELQMPPLGRRAKKPARRKSYRIADPPSYQRRRRRRRVEFGFELGRYLETVWHVWHVWHGRLILANAPANGSGRAPRSAGRPITAIQARLRAEYACARRARAFSGLGADAPLFPLIRDGRTWLIARGRSPAYLRLVSGGRAPRIQNEERAPLSLLSCPAGRQASFRVLSLVTGASPGASSKHAMCERERIRGFSALCSMFYEVPARSSCARLCGGGAHTPRRPPAWPPLRLPSARGRGRKKELGTLDSGSDMRRLAAVRSNRRRISAFWGRRLYPEWTIRLEAPLDLYPFTPGAFSVLYCACSWRFVRELTLQYIQQFISSDQEEDDQAWY
ncbi:hypothetical protein DFH11DRAFT_1739910 [Phellopilus nigrolimitatus]|nr:hypothetical protein DFH11DRAFT_1739910 [Phellopilus nigrolimitatus]